MTREVRNADVALHTISLQLTCSCMPWVSAVAAGDPCGVSASNTLLALLMRPAVQTAAMWPHLTVGPSAGPAAASGHHPLLLPAA
jgi:hypothetical protein